MPRGRAFALAASGLGALALGALWLALGPGSPPGPTPVAQGGDAGAAPAAASPAQGSESALAVGSGATLSLAMASLPDEALEVDLLFPEPSTSREPLPARILAPDGRLLELPAGVGADARRARIEIPAGWLAPGRYIIELKTTERSHFPLRRYALEVR